MEDKIKSVVNVIIYVLAAAITLFTSLNLVGAIEVTTSIQSVVTALGGAAVIIANIIYDIRNGKLTEKA